MKVLITGVAGFIGFHLSQHLLRKNFDIIGIDNETMYPICYNTNRTDIDILISKQKKSTLKKNQLFFFIYK